VDGKKAFFEDPLPAGLERDRLFDGEENDGKFVHPSPQGHKAYALAVIHALKDVFKEKSFPFKNKLPRFAKRGSRAVFSMAIGPTISSG
jgi:hypothetical protein